MIDDIVMFVKEFVPSPQRGGIKFSVSVLASVFKTRAEGGIRLRTVWSGTALSCRSTSLVEFQDPPDCRSRTRVGEVYSVIEVIGHAPCS